MRPGRKGRGGGAGAPVGPATDPAAMRRRVLEYLRSRARPTNPWAELLKDLRKALSPPGER